MAIGTIMLDCASLDDSNAGTIDRIACLQLAARRCGAEVRLAHAHSHLVELIDLCGLAAVLRIEPERQPE